MRALIVDDDPLNIDLVASFCKRYAPDVEVIGKALNVDAGIEALIQLKPDLLFLDVELYDMTGLDILKAVPQPDLMVIMVTAHEKYAMEAVSPRLMGYLLKPLSIPAFVTAVEDCRGVCKLRSALAPEPVMSDLKYLRISKNDDILTIPVDSIVHLESEGPYTYIKTDNHAKEIVAKPLTYFEDKLPSASFYRVHNSHIINVRKITKLLRQKPGFIVLSNGDKVPIATRKKKEIFERFFI